MTAHKRQVKKSRTFKVWACVDDQGDLDIATVTKAALRRQYHHIPRRMMVPGILTLSPPPRRGEGK